MTNISLKEPHREFGLSSSSESLRDTVQQPTRPGQTAATPLVAVGNDGGVL